MPKEHTQQELNLEVFQDITRQIKNGSYFSDALNWYTVKYLTPVSQRSFLIFITFFAVIASIVSCAIMLSFFPLIIKVPMALEIPAKKDAYANFRAIGSPLEPPGESVVEYLAGHYVTMRENYTFDQLRNGMNFVQTYSGDTVQNNYRTFIRPETNPQSPVFLYRNHTTRKVTILNSRQVRNASFGGSGPSTRQVEVTFRAVESSPGKKISNTWLAKLEIQFSEPVYQKETKKFVPIDFKVTQYEVTPLENPAPNPTTSNLTGQINR